MSTRLFGEFTWIWYATILVFVTSAIAAPGTVQPSALFAMLPFAAILAIVAVGQTILIQQRGLDMSCVGLITLGGLLVAKLGFVTGSIYLAVLLTLIFALALGILNGMLIAKLNITPIVATLATNALFMGGVRTISGGSPMTAPQEIADVAHQRFFGVPLMLILAIVFILVVSFVVRSTVAGRRFVAVGANPAAAAAAGIPVLSYQVGAYAAAAVCFGVAGIFYTGFIGSASQVAGSDYLLPGIAAVVVGGTPFTGGRGSVIASGVAALFLTQLGQMVLALGAGTAIQFLVQALAIVIAVSVRHLPALIVLLRGRCLRGKAVLL
ncbi:ABC transporter permease [Mesorhizobium sp. B2-4-9]|nr:ABC transporter permease [Mesorhizobium sp. B2-4-9]